MSASSLERMIESCAYGSEMPRRAEQLVSTVASLTGRQRRRAYAHMRFVDLEGYMAKRATEVAGFNSTGAIRIANAMMKLFRPERSVAALRTAGYLNTQMERASRHLAGGNRTLAEQIYGHIRWNLGIDDDEAARLCWAFDFDAPVTAPELPPGRHDGLAPAGWSSGKFALLYAI